MNYRIPTLILCLFLTTINIIAQDKDLFRSLHSNRGEGSIWIKYRDIEHAWYKHIHQMADDYLLQRIEEVAKVKTLGDWNTRKRVINQKLIQSVGGLLSKTPLHAKTVEILERETFTVEKIIYESQPDFFVTACLFLPKERTAPLPAVIYCSGHTADGFRSETYQRVMINLVQKGFAVFAFDPLGQGERYQYLDEDGTPIFRSTNEHSYTGIQTMLVGKSVARYMIHDGIRAVDYLQGRPEIDGQRIGITGRSGGGTQSAYIAAFDDRIYAVAPENYITNFKRIWASIGPQDGEQNFLSANKMGIDHADLLSIRAPKPALVLTTDRDFFSIQGAKETYKEVKNLYKRYDAENNLSFAEDHGGHGSTPSNREKTYAFFQKHLQLPGNSKDIEVQIFSAKELQITETGQVVSSLKSQTVFDLINKEFPRFPSRKKEETINWLKKQVLPHLQKPHQVFTGEILSEDYVVERYFLEFEGGHYPIPFLKIKAPKTNPIKTILYLNAEGKSEEIKPDGEIIKLIRKGYEVIAVDLLNIGELSASSFRGDSHIQDISFNLVLGSSLVGTSLPMLQTQDLLMLLQHLKTEYGKKEFVGIANSSLCIPLLQANAITHDFKQVILKEPLTSWESFLRTRNYAPTLAYSLVPNVLSYYDIPDLIKWNSTKGRVKIITNEDILDVIE